METPFGVVPLVIDTETEHHKIARSHMLGLVSVPSGNRSQTKQLLRCCPYCFVQQCLGDLRQLPFISSDALRQGLHIYRSRIVLGDPE